jgi:hypothetical protein
MEITMNRMIFIKEVFLKNDLTYLTLCYFLFMSSLNIGTGPEITPFVISGIYLLISWFFSIKDRNIFNSVYKFMIIPAIAIFFMSIVTPINDMQFSGITNALNGFFMMIFTLIVIYIGNSLLPSEKRNRYAVYDANNRNLETEYLKHTCRSLSYNGNISYHYDERVNVYVYDDSIHLAGNRLFVKKSDKTVVGSLPDYYKYFKDLNMNYESMNEQSLEVFKMYAI